MDKSKLTLISERFTTLFALLVIVISLIVLVGWYCSLMFLTRFSINEVPMAPSTAYVFMALAAGLWFYLRPQKTVLNRIAAISCAISALCLSCLIIITNIVGFYGTWEHAFITLPETQLSMKLGHMSLVTALLFVITGFSLLFLLSKRKTVRTLSVIFTLIILLISFVLLLAYAFGAPFFYFDNFIPPAVLTVLSFFLVSLALIAASDKNTFLIKTIWKSSTSSKLLRVFLPTTVAITVIESLIVIRILPLINVHPAVGVSIVTLTVVAVVVVVVLILSKSLGKSLDAALTNLSESEEKFRIVFENSPVGRSMTGIDGSLHVNESFCKMLGYTAEELKAKTWMDISHPDEIQQITEITESLLNRTLSQAQFEKRYIHKNGDTIFTDVSTYLQRDNSGDPQFFITSVFDITERKLAEEKEKIHTRNIDILSKTAMQFVDFPQDSNIYDFVGKQIREFVGKESYIVVNSVDRKSGFSTIESVLGVGKLAKIITNKLGRHPVGMKLEVEDQNAHYHDGRLHVYKEGLYGILLNTVPKSICKSIEKLAGLNKIYVIDLSNKEQFFGNVILFLKDTSEELKNKQLIETFVKQASIAILKKQAEEALRINEEKLDLIINSSPIGICMVDILGNFVTTNSAYERMVDYSKEELVGLSFFDVTHPNDRPKNKKLFQEMFSLETADFSMEKRYRRKNGEEINVSVQAIGIRDTEGNVKFGTAFVDDITERKRAEQTISLSHNRYMTLFNESPIPLWEEDFTELSAYLFEIKEAGHNDLSTYFDNNPDELGKCAGMVKILDVNQAALDLYGANSREQLIADFSTTFTENFFSIFKKEMISLAEGKKIFESEAEIKILSGDLKHIYVTLKIDYSLPGMVKALLSTSDITELKRAEKALLENQKRYKNAQAMGHVGNWEYDILTTEFWASDEAKKIYGLDSNTTNFTTEDVERCIPQRAEVHQALIDLIEHDKKYDLVFDILTADKGIRKTIHSIAEIQRDTLGNPSKINGVVSDVSKQKKADKELKESEEKLNTLFSSLTEMVVIHELVLDDAGEAINYRITDCNTVFTEYTGISKKDAVGKLATDVYQTKTPPYLEVFSKVGLSRKPVEFSAYFAALDRHLMISVVSPQTGKFATITTDITPMMQIQEAIVAKNREMENYLYIASHDLRSPLVNIQGFSQRLKTEADAIKKLINDTTVESETGHQLAAITDENIPKTLNFIFSNIEKMDTLISGLLQISRTGRMEMNIHEVDMNRLFAKILHSLDFQIKETNCKIHVDSLPTCYGDANLLDQLFTNILSNALNYYDTERPLEITVNAKTVFNKVVYTIHDTGKGIAPKHLDKIWDVFFRVDPKLGKAGEGIGLSLVKRITEKHKGKIGVESEENIGSVFHIELHNRKFTEI